jgi:lantibiotic modifying enzyme
VYDACVSEYARIAEDGVRSVFGVLERKAERQADGIRWQTLDWDNEPHYTPAIFIGTGGISFFLADYFRVTGERRALELADGAVRWCASPSRDAERNPEWDWCRNGIMRGRSGLGLAWMTLAAASGDRAHLAHAAAIGTALLREPIGPVTDWQDGAAGEALFLLRLGEATEDERFVEGAVARAAWLESVAVREDGGCVWPWQTDHKEYANWRGLSFVPGSSGIAYVLACLYARTQDERWAVLVRAAAETLRREAREDKRGLNWPDTRGGFERGELRKCQWCYGASGVGLFLCKAYTVLGDDDLRRLARAAGETTYAYGDARRNPCLCHGLAGNASLFLDLYAATGNGVWQERAGEFARLIARYRQATPEGDEWQSDDPGCHSPDFLYGVSGTGHFLLRLWQPDVVQRAPLL